MLTFDKVHTILRRITWVAGPLALVMALYDAYAYGLGCWQLYVCAHAAVLVFIMELQIYDREARAGKWDFRPHIDRECASDLAARKRYHRRMAAVYRDMPGMEGVVRHHERAAFNVAALQAYKRREPHEGDS